MSNLSPKETERTIKLLRGYAKVLNELAKELPKYGADDSFCETLKGVGSKLLCVGVSLPFKTL